ncbi:hypothetical protein Pmani_031562 [Petrolisthes manimaculis]|uniref:Uncharacterized protein n=1 Tax=Petrolisthes manimaculis TaxID=1843537 RepID=A0AAE1NVE4_9EUCA|nr:hypothetical protein Pmani_031562 [Petrolisthes manimaculis]
MHRSAGGVNDMDPPPPPPLTSLHLLPSALTLTYHNSLLPPPTLSDLQLFHPQNCLSYLPHLTPVPTYSSCYLPGLTPTSSSSHLSYLTSISSSQPTFPITCLIHIPTKSSHSSTSTPNLSSSSHYLQYLLTPMHLLPLQSSPLSNLLLPSPPTPPTLHTHLLLLPPPACLPACLPSCLPACFTLVPGPKSFLLLLSDPPGSLKVRFTPRSYRPPWALETRTGGGGTRSLITIF